MASRQIADKSAPLFALLVFAGTVLLYLPGLNGPFLLDDMIDIVANPAVAMVELSLDSVTRALFSGDLGYPHRGLARLSFALNHYFSGGLNEIHFKLTNAAIHAFNGVLVLVFARALVRRLFPAESESTSAYRFLGLLIAAVWVVHPIHVSGVLYIVQRMNLLAATAVLSGLVVFLHGRRRLDEGRDWALAYMYAGVGGCAAVGFLFKENALLLPAFAFLLEWFFFPAARPDSDTRKALKRFYLVTVGLPVLALLGLVLFNSDFILRAYDYREFTPVQRLLTESRVLWFYVLLIGVPYFRWYGLHHDDIGVSHDLISPLATLPAVTAWLLLLTVCLCAFHRRHLWVFGVLWFLLGHSMESGVIGLELVYEHRNYLPALGPMFVLVVLLQRGASRLRLPPRPVRVVIALALGALLFSAALRTVVWGSDGYTFFSYQIANHPNSYRTRMNYGAYSLAEGNDVRTGFRHFQSIAADYSERVLPLFEMARMVSFTLYALETGKLRPSAQGSDGDSVFTDPLPLDKARLRFWLGRLDAEIRRRLETVPNQGSISIALVRTAACARRSRPNCVFLRPLTAGWVAAARHNPRIATQARLLLERVE